MISTLAESDMRFLFWIFKSRATILATIEWLGFYILFQEIGRLNNVPNTRTLSN